MQTFTSALALAAAIKNKEVSPVEVAKHYLERADRFDKTLCSLIWRRDRELLDEAKAAEKAVMQGDATAPFHGVPIPIKDLTEVAGQPFELGSCGAPGKMGQVDAPSVRRLREAGFLLMGRTHAPEFGSTSVTESQRHGACRNPWDTLRTPGGSSGGAAAAVAAGLAPLAHGSDGGGSLRIPAACCGLVGLKASRGRIPRGPLVSDVMHGFSTDGVVTTNVADSAALLDVMAHLQPTSWRGAPPVAPRPYQELAQVPPKKLRIAFTTRAPVPTNPDTTSIQAVTQTASILAALGHDVFEAHPTCWDEDHERLTQAFLLQWAAGMAYCIGFDWTKCEAFNRELFHLASRASAVDYIHSKLALEVFSTRTMHHFGKDFDLLLTPVLAMPPPAIGWLYENPAADATQMMWRLNEMVPYTCWFNITGQPAIALPVGHTKEGLPTSVQLVAPPWREDLLLSVGQVLETQLGWDRHFPVEPKLLP